MTHQSGYLYRKSGVWYVRYRETVLDADGKPKRRRVSSPALGRFRLKSEARTAADAFLKPINEGSQRPEATMLLGIFVERHWLPHVAATLRLSSHASYRDTWNYVRGTRLAQQELRHIRTVDIEQWFGALRPLSRNTLRSIRALLSGVFKWARRSGVLDTPNPVQDVQLPRGRPVLDTYAYSLEEVTQMLMRLDLRAGAIVAVAAFTGLRKGEIAGLRWEDYREGQIFVSRRRWRRDMDDPKTPKSKAPVPVIEPLSRILGRLRDSQGGKQEGWMFGHQPAYLENAARYTLKKVAPTWRGWHAFRRGLATNLSQLNVDERVIQQILRHESVDTTRIYIKSRPSSVEAFAAMRKLEMALGAEARVQ